MASDQANVFVRLGKWCERDAAAVKTSEKEETSPSWPGDVPNSRGGEFGKMYVVELACGEKPQQILGMM